MSISKSIRTLIHPASQNELDALKTNAFRADSPKCVTMPFAGGDTVSEWVTVAGARSTPVFLYEPDAEETPNAFAARLSAACKLPVLKVSSAAIPDRSHEEVVENIISIFKALQKARIPAEQIVLLGRARGAMIALSALLRMAGADGPLPRCAIAVSPIIDDNRPSESIQANEGKSLKSQADPSMRLAENCPLLVIAADDEAINDDCIRFAERAASAGIDTTLSLYAGMPRDFPLFDLPSSRGLLREIEAFASRRAPSESSAQVETPLTIQRVGWAG